MKKSENIWIYYLRFLSYRIVHKASAEVEVSEIQNEEEISMWRITSIRGRTCHASISRQISLKISCEFKKQDMYIQCLIFIWTNGDIGGEYLDL